jgi:diaminohydroxyphosphoribosylaminopyrimidine deaminase/5-amino-6-(5-phosphoribosylamino)uracil reductase
METIRFLPVPTKGTPLSGEQAMSLAISEAYRGATRVSPNPLVGAVVLDSKGGFLSSGHHEFFGGPHAEVNALKGLSRHELDGAHVFVTLEPCAHEGKTPSCAKMMAQLPLKKVTYGLVDPNPLVSGQGARILQTAGIEAELFAQTNSEFGSYPLAMQLEEVCEAFLWNFRKKKTFVSLKMASSLDGQIALRSGESQWITGPESREYVHYLRACHDAILVGKGTVQFDNPSLNVRHSKIQKENKVVILDGEGHLLAKFDSLKVASVHPAENLFWCVSADLKEHVENRLTCMKVAPQVVFVKTRVGGDLDLGDLLNQLFSKGIKSIMVEGGAQTASSFIDGGYVNRIYMFLAPIIMGSGGSKSWTETIRIASMKDKIPVKNPKYLTFGSDFMITGSL